MDEFTVEMICGKGWLMFGLQRRRVMDGKSSDD